MSDIKIIWRDYSGSVAVENGDLLHDESLYTAVVISLFTDRLANNDDILPGDKTDRRGWWGDSFSDNDNIGSRLWLLRREKQLKTVLERAREYAQEALQWLVDDGVAKRVLVRSSNTKTSILLLDIQIDRPDKTEKFQFNALWEKL